MCLKIDGALCSIKEMYGFGRIAKCYRIVSSRDKGDHVCLSAYLNNIARSIAMDRK